MKPNLTVNCNCSCASITKLFHLSLFNGPPSICNNDQGEVKKINFEIEEYKKYKKQTKRDSSEREDGKSSKTFFYCCLMKNFHFIQMVFMPASVEEKVCGAIEKGSKGEFPIIKAFLQFTFERRASRTRSDLGNYF